MENYMELPAVALRNVVFLPGMLAHFDLKRDRSVAAVNQAIENGQKIFVTAQKDGEAENPGMEGLFRIGTVCRIRQTVKLPTGLLRVLVDVQERAMLLRIAEEETTYLLVSVSCIEEEKLDPEDPHSIAMVRMLIQGLEEFTSGNKKMRDAMKHLFDITDVNELMRQMSQEIPVPYKSRQLLLETFDPNRTYDLLIRYLKEEAEVNRIKQELQEKVKAQIDQNQREYILREQMKAIRSELKEDDIMTDADAYMETVEKLKIPEEIKERLAREVRRFRSMPANMAESSMLRNYLDTVLELPWDRSTKENRDLQNAELILERDHYGLQKVKERVLEFLAVNTFTQGKQPSPIICLAGPPGTGKTSIARSVAEALNKKYVRISLGGVKDEAEIRGHRRTYVGAMPGRIMNAVKLAGSSNPLILLDEVDKLGNDYKGDPASALLEVLDSEQNKSFRDHFVEIPFDLSKVLFICTANNVQTIPRPLLDRMELIEVNSYTQNEKMHIAKEHLIPKQAKKHGFEEKEIVFTDDAVKKLIQGYTRETGVRNLERQIAAVCRKTAKEVLEGKVLPAIVTADTILSYLGKEKVQTNPANEQPEIGIVRGLAWTSVGGDTLQVEVNTMPGKGELQLTGQLGDVMKESARIALSFVRSIAKNYGVADKFFEKHTIHIHVPDGATPKDGPSAGVTIATALLSAAAGIPVRPDVAMTGEISLRGRVMPIGGLKEKLLAAKLAGIKTVVVPEKNRPDVEEIEAEITDGLEIIFASKFETVAARALVTKTEGI